VQGWLHEIHYRAKQTRVSCKPDSAEHTIAQDRKEIFVVLDFAGALLTACGTEVEKMVGEETRRLLTSECVKALASTYDGRLNNLIDHRLYDRGRR